MKVPKILPRVQLKDEAEEYLNQCVRIDRANLHREFEHLSADMAYWNQRHGEALQAHLLAKLDRERGQAQLALELRERLAVEHSRVTEAMVESAVLTHARYRELRLAESDAEVTTLQMRGVCEALRCKRDMLISLGAQVRAEMDGSPSIRHRPMGRFDAEEG